MLRSSQWHTTYKLIFCRLKTSKNNKKESQKYTKNKKTVDKIWQHIFCHYNDIENKKTKQKTHHTGYVTTKQNFQQKNSAKAESKLIK